MPSVSRSGRRVGKTICGLSDPLGPICTMSIVLRAQPLAAKTFSASPINSASVLPAR